MQRTYAGTLGLIAFGILTARGVIEGSGTEATLLAACGGTFLFGLIGAVAGYLADLFVRDSVRSQFQTAMAAWENKNENQK